MEECKDCKECETLETIPYVAHQGAVYREERKTKMWMRAFFVVLALLVVTNFGWLVYDMKGDSVILDKVIDMMVTE